MTEPWFLTNSKKKNNSKNKNYDVTIDPGHGGMDGGGASGNYKETDFTMDISKKVKSNLEKAGITVKLTHDEGDIDKNHVTLPPKPLFERVDDEMLEKRKQEFSQITDIKQYLI